MHKYHNKFNMISQPYNYKVTILTNIYAQIP